MASCTPHKTWHIHVLFISSSLTRWSQSRGVSWPRPHRAWSVQLDFPPGTSLTQRLAEPVLWQRLRCEHLVFPSPPGPWLCLPMLLCVPEPSLNHILLQGRVQLDDERLFWHCQDIGEARGGKLEKPTLGMPGQTPILTKCSWKHASVASHDVSLFLKFLI